MRGPLEVERAVLLHCDGAHWLDGPLDTAPATLEVPGRAHCASCRTAASVQGQTLTQAGAVVGVTIDGLSFRAAPEAAIVFYVAWIMWTTITTPGPVCIE